MLQTSITRALTVLFICVLIDPSQPCLPATQSTAMLAFRSGLGKFPSSWNQTDICAWDFVSCNGTTSTGICGSNTTATTFITSIDALGSTRELEGRFPANITSITTLETLNLFDQLMNGSLPSDIGRLANLRVLQLGMGDTQTALLLGGQLPASFGNLNKLRVIQFKWTSFVGSLPPAMANFTDLETLDVAQNFFTGPIPDLSNLTNLTTLLLNVNAFVGNVTVPPSVTTCDLTANELTCVFNWWICRTAGEVKVSPTYRCGLAPTTATTQVAVVPTSNDGSGDQNLILSVAVGSAAGGVVLIALIVVIVLVAVRRRARKFISPTPSAAQPSLKGQTSHVSVVSMQTPPDAAQEPPEGQLDIIPFNQLRFIKELGSGSFGQVYKGIYKNRPVAIKISMAIDPKHITEFLGEAEVMTSIKHHKNVLRLFGICIHESKPIIVLEFMGGGTLLGHLQSTAYISDEQQLKYLRGIAAGLQPLAQHSLVHRDLAARNILLDETMEPKIADFGMSRVVRSEDKVGQTQTNMGPIRWMAPESIRNLVYSEASDVWSYGVLVWEIVTRKAPHAEMSLLELAVKIRDKGVTPGIPHDCPPYIQQLLSKCWQFEPENRPSFAEICDYLAQVRVDAEQPGSAPPPDTEPSQAQNQVTIQVE
eukprot:TRINITY_DN5270_c0_g2_i1.p1 TRINITY_DN5270_c0_g2~~TRINITY_DN5270_c0_g2_i1.p1  ORF type:complete len:650 (+),score=204.34 TRINITY_DN5270_c0_g2_i1:113-2062(+)